MPEKLSPTSGTSVDRNILGLALPGVLLAIACLIPVTKHDSYL